MIPNKKTARLAGFLWLLMCISGIFAQVFVRDRIFVTGDTAMTAKNIVENAFLLRVGFLSDVFMLLCYLFTGMVFYKLFASVNKNLASIMIILVICGTSIGLYNLLHEYEALYLLSGSEYLNAFGAEQLKAQAMLSFDLYLHGYEIAHIFFSLWVLPLGLLVYRSSFLPKIFGILFILETCTYIPAIIIHFLAPNRTLENNMQMLGVVAEITFMLWLLIRGIIESKVKVQSQTERKALV